MTLKEFDKIMNEARELFIRKTNDYVGSKNQNEFLVNALGLRGRFVDLWRKIMRLKTLVWDGDSSKVKDETIKDTLIDMLIYSVMAINDFEREYSNRSRKNDKK